LIEQPKVFQRTEFQSRGQKYMRLFVQVVWRSFSPDMVPSSLSLEAIEQHGDRGRDFFPLRPLRTLREVSFFVSHDGRKKPHAKAAKENTAKFLGPTPRLTSAVAPLPVFLKLL